MKEKSSEKKSTAKKNPLFIVAAVGIVLLGVGYYFYNQRGAGKDEMAMMGDSESSEGSNAFTSIKDALSRSVSLVCEYSDDSGASHKTYIKNGAVRIDSQGGEGSEVTSAIIKDDKMYSWSEKTKEGFIFPIEKDEGSSGTDDISPGSARSSQSIINAIEQYKDYCKVSSVSDSNFEVPADVAFKDISTMFEGLPSGIE